MGKALIETLREKLAKAAGPPGEPTLLATAGRFLQPEFRSSALLGRHFGARKHRKGIEPNGHRWAKYKVKGSQLNGSPPYKAVIQLKAGMVPPNLIHERGFLGFDYGLSPRQVADRVVAGQQIVWERTLDFEF